MVKTLRHYIFNLEIYDDSGESDYQFTRAVEESIVIFMEAKQVKVRLVKAADVQTEDEECGSPILAEVKLVEAANVQTGEDEFGNPILAEA